MNHSSPVCQDVFCLKATCLKVYTAPMPDKTTRISGGGGPLVPHLERGWELLEKGDRDGARQAAEQALILDSTSPDARVLLGTLATLEGDPEEALELMQQAMDLDHGYIRPVLAAAEICIHQLGDLDLGLDLCDEAVDLAGDDEEELLEVLLLRVEGLLVGGEPDDAETLGQSLVDVPLQEPGRSLRVGRALLELGAIDSAAEHLHHAATVAELEADATYFLGLLADRGGDLAAAEQRFFQVLELDRQAPPPPWTVTTRAVERALEQALELLDPTVADLFMELPRVIADFPPAELVCDGLDPRAPLFVAMRAPLEPELPGEGPADNTPRHTRVFLYKRCLERACLGEEEMAEELAFALEEEADGIESLGEER